MIGLRNPQTAGKTSFQGVSETGFLEEVSIWIGEPNKVDEPPQDGWVSFHLLRGPNITKRQRGAICSLCLNWCIHLLLTLDISSLFLRPFGLRLNYTINFPVLWHADGKSWQFLDSIVTVWANSYKKSLWVYVFIYVCISPMGSAFLENSNTYTQHLSELCNPEFISYCFKSQFSYHKNGDINTI